MARSLLQRFHNYPGNTLAMTGIAAGSLLVVMPSSGANGTQTCSDDRGASYTKKAETATNEGAIWYTWNAGSGTHNVTVANLPDVGVTGYQISGPDSSDPFSGEVVIEGALTTAGDETTSITGPGDGGCLVASWGNTVSGGDTFEHFEPAAAWTDQGHDTGHYDADGTAFGSLGTGSLTVGWQHGSGANNIYSSYRCVAFLPETGGAAAAGPALRPSSLIHTPQFRR